MRSTIEVGDQLMLEGQHEAFGAVREVHRGPSPSLTVWIENLGEYILEGTCVRRAHDGKVEVVFDELPTDLQDAIRHAHDAETRY